MQPATVVIPAQSAMPVNEPRFKDKPGSAINGFLGLFLHLILSIVNIGLLFTGPGAALL